MLNIFHLDVRGLPCPQPILKAKALLDSGHRGPLTVGLDNEVSAVNVAAFLQGSGLSTQMYQSGSEWLVLGRSALSPNILVWHTPQGWQAVVDQPGAEVEGEDEAIIDLPPPLAPTSGAGVGIPPAALAPDGPGQGTIIAPSASVNPGDGQVLNVEPDTVVMVSSQLMGQGDGALGDKLMISFFETLATLGRPPLLMGFYNSGVLLTTRESAVLPALLDLEQQGAAVFSCGVCLEHYNLKHQLKVGRVGNMYEIINAQKSAVRVIRP